MKNINTYTIKVGQVIEKDFLGAVLYNEEGKVIRRIGPLEDPKLVANKYAQHRKRKVILVETVATSKVTRIIELMGIKLPIAETI